MLHQEPGHINVMLLSVGHQNADHTILTQGLGTERGHNGAVLAAGDADNGVAAFPVALKPVADPLDNILCYFFSIKHNGPPVDIFSYYITLLPSFLLFTF